MKIIIINGPNLNLLGIREPEIYGRETFEEYFTFLKEKFPAVSLEYYQSNHEGTIIDKLQEAALIYDGIILNPAAYTHYSYAIYDAIRAINVPVIEVHISDISTREEFRKKSVISPACIHQIKGKGLKGYQEAIEFLVQYEMRNS